MNIERRDLNVKLTDVTRVAPPVTGHLVLFYFSWRSVAHKRRVCQTKSRRMSSPPDVRSRTKNRRTKH